MFTQGGLGKPLTGKIIIFSKGRITVDGVEISKEENDWLHKDSRRKLLAALAARQEYRKREEKIKKEKNTIAQHSSGAKKQNLDNLKQGS